jgi:hypothetical protein
MVIKELKIKGFCIYLPSFLNFISLPANKIRRTIENLVEIYPWYTIITIEYNVKFGAFISDIFI